MVVLSDVEKVVQRYLMLFPDLFDDISSDCVGMRITLNEDQDIDVVARLLSFFNDDNSVLAFQTEYAEDGRLMFCVIVR